VAARSAPDAAAFAPQDRPRVVVAQDGTLAAIVEPRRVVVVDVPGCGPFAEIGVDADAEATDVAWVGTPPRLLVLGRYAGHSTVHLIDPHGPRPIAEIRLEAPMRLAASVGAYALAVGGLGAAVLATTDTHVAPYQFPARAVPVAAGSAGGQFVVALAAAIEEWDPHARMPKRRLKLPRPAVITALGGSDRVVWMTTQNEPTRVDVIPLVNRGQPKHHELPEPIAHVAAHPRSDLLACIGAERGRVYVVDLDGRQPVRALEPSGIDRAESAGLVVGRVVAALVAQTKKPLAVVTLETPLERPSPSPSHSPSPSAFVAAKSSLYDDPDPDPPPPRSDARASWRDDLAVWARAFPSAAIATEPPAVLPIDELAARFDIASLAPAVALLYGAHLAGERGAAPLDVARALDLTASPSGDAARRAQVPARERWDDALGRGALAARGVAVYRESRVLLAPACIRALDELPPHSGALIGRPGTSALAGACVVVARDDRLDAVAARHLAIVGGAILAAHDDADPREVALEARARGAVAMVRASERVALDEPILVVVRDDAAADQLAIPRLR
jgi:hypothetical protein